MKYFTRYSPAYIRSLVYMLQASEYNPRDYLKWYHRTSDFSSVEKRKKLVPTQKARLLMTMGIIVSVMGYLAAISFAWNGSLLVGLIILAAMPYIVAYGYTVLNFLVELIQSPVEAGMVRTAQEKLSKHKAVRIGIAGSFGKTTIREILKTVLSEGLNTAAPKSSYNTPLGIAKFVSGLSGEEDVLIFELGEYYPGDVKKLCRIVDPQIGVITGVNEAHLEKFGTLDATGSTVFELADYLQGNPVYVNAESAEAVKHAAENHKLFSREGGAGLKVSDAKTGLDGTSFKIQGEGLDMEVKSGLLGLHHVGPLVAAAAIAKSLGLSPEQIKAGISKTKPFAHRLEPKIDPSGVITIDDSYNGNPTGVSAIIAFMTSLPNRRFYVTPGLVEMGSSAQAVHENIGRELAEAGIENVVLIRNSVTGYIESGLKKAGYAGKITWFDDALVAYSSLHQLTLKDDVVVLQNDWPDQYA